jgi:hypothetical protein
LISNNVSFEHSIRFCLVCSMVIQSLVNINSGIYDEKSKEIMNVLSVWSISHSNWWSRFSMKIYASLIWTRLKERSFRVSLMIHFNWICPKRKYSAFLHFRECYNENQKTKKIAKSSKKFSTYVSFVKKRFFQWYNISKFVFQ